jgi:O-antigen/teichoic acid export membrane protein
MNSIIAPHISRLLSSGDLQELSNRLQVCSTLLMGTILFPCIFIFLFPDVVVGIFGDEYLGHTLALIILVSGQIVNVCAGSVGYVLMMSGNSSVYLNNTLGGYLVCLVLSLLLIPKFGLTGGAIASVAALMIRNIWSAIFIFRRFRIRTTPSIYGLKMIFNQRGLGHALQ